MSNIPLFGESKTLSTYRVAKEELNFQLTLHERETKCCVRVDWQKSSGFAILSSGKKEMLSSQSWMFNLLFGDKEAADMSSSISRIEFSIHY